MAKPFSRRKFLEQSAWVGSALAVGYHGGTSAATESNSPSEKLNIAAVGVHNRAGANIAGVDTQNIVALCDIDEQFLEQAGAKYPHARKYRDYRVMLEKEAEKIDAVVVGTPDHSHAPASAMAMHLKKHTYCEKPLTHTVYEARTLARLAKANGLATQMGTQIHAGDNYRRVVELIQSGAIGEVREAHVFHGSNYTGRRLITGKPAPKHVNWDLWLGPTASRPYCESFKEDNSVIPVHPFHWRWFWDFGTGSMGDFGCHYMDLTHWALKLKYPTRISTSGPTPLLESATAGVAVEYEYPARENLPPVRLTWYDGGRQPDDVLATLKNEEGQPLNWGPGQLFIGSEGMLISNYSAHKLLPVEKYADFQRPEPFIPKSMGHHNEWIYAIKNGAPTTCNFEYSGALTESVLLGLVSYRSGEPLEWDADQLLVSNSEKAQQLIHKEYRKGWTL